MKIKAQIFLFVSIFVIGSAIVKAQVATGGTYTLNQSVIAAGGGTSSDATGNVYRVQGTAGQPAAGTFSYGGSYVLKGGFWNSTALAPTAAQVSISGRVLTSDHRGLANARVIITDAKGQSWSVMSSAFGNFQFEGATAGETIIISVTSKHYTFAPQVISLTDNISGLILTAQ